MIGAVLYCHNNIGSNAVYLSSNCLYQTKPTLSFGPVARAQLKVQAPLGPRVL